MWEVSEVVPLKKISYDWRYVGYAGDGSVTFDLSDQGDATSLVLTHTVRKDFPDDVPQFKRESCLAGWRYFIGERLKGYLEKVVDPP